MDQINVKQLLDIKSVTVNENYILISSPLHKDSTVSFIENELTPLRECGLYKIIKPVEVCFNNEQRFICTEVTLTEKGVIYFNDRKLVSFLLENIKLVDHGKRNLHTNRESSQTLKESPHISFH